MTQPEKQKQSAADQKPEQVQEPVQPVQPPTPSVPVIAEPVVDWDELESQAGQVSAMASLMTTELRRLKKALAKGNTKVARDKATSLLTALQMAKPAADLIKAALSTAEIKAFERANRPAPPTPPQRGSKK